MYAKHMIATVAMIAATSSVFARQGESVDPAANFMSTKTRADVTAELKRAQADGTYVAGGAETQELYRQLAEGNQAAAMRAAAPGKTRADVRKELAQALAEGGYLIGGEEYAGQADFTTRSMRAGVDAAGVSRNAHSASGMSDS